MSENYEEQARELLKKLKEVREKVPVVEGYEKEWQELQERFDKVSSKFEELKKSGISSSSPQLTEMAKELEELRGRIREFNEKMKRNFPF